MRPLFLCTLFLTASAAAQTQQVVLHDINVYSHAALPQSTLVEVSPGQFFGTGIGALFQVSSSGVFEVTKTFGNSGDSEVSPGAFVPASNGYLYGIRLDGDGHSAIYRTNTAGTKGVLLNQSLQNSSPLVEGSDGNLWGTQGSTRSGYSAFKASLAGALTTVATGLPGETEGPLVQATDGNFYGATASVLMDGNAIAQIYRVTASGVYTPLYTFPVGEGSAGGLMQASDGLLYGTALYVSDNCPSQVGEIFSISLSGEFTSEYQFTSCYGPQGISVGPFAGLIQASDGLLYGTTQSSGGPDGSVFSFDPVAKTFQTVFRFNITDGELPATFGPALVQGSDGGLYGTTQGGGEYQGGVIYKLELGLTPPLPSVRLIQPSSAAPGATILLTGNYLLGLSAVSFNGTPATFTAINVNYATAVVPQGATTGPITVTTMNGSTTTQSFTVQ